MKVALACQSVLLEKSLEIFLKKYISSYKQCDFVVSDRKIEIEKPLFFISVDDSNLKPPFSKSSLMIELEKFYSSIAPNEEVADEISKQNPDIDVLEQKISELTDEFRDNLVNVIKEYYEK